MKLKMITVTAGLATVLLLGGPALAANAATATPDPTTPTYSIGVENGEVHLQLTGATLEAKGNAFDVISAAGDDLGALPTTGISKNGVSVYLHYSLDGTSGATVSASEITLTRSKIDCAAASGLGGAAGAAIGGLFTGPFDPAVAAGGLVGGFIAGLITCP